MVKRENKGDKENTRGVKKVPRKPFKSNLLAISHLFSQLGANLRVEHINAMKLTPFYHLFIAFYEGNVISKNISKSNELTSQLVDNYSKVKHAIMIGERAVRILPSDFQLIFGISSGTTPIKIKPTKKPETLFVRRLCGSDKNITQTALRREMEVSVNGRSQEEVESFVKMFCLYALSAVFHSTTGTVIGFGFLEFIEDLDKMLNYAWADFFANTLIESLNKSSDKKDSFVGCAALLQFWLCEHTRLVKPVSKEYVPRFLKWKLPSILKKAGGEKYGNIPKTKVKKGALEVTLKEARLYRISMHAIDSGCYIVHNPIPFGFIYEMSIVDIVEKEVQLENATAPFEQEEYATAPFEQEEYATIDTNQDNYERLVSNDSMDIVTYNQSNERIYACESECNHTELLEKIRILECALEDERHNVNKFRTKCEESDIVIAEMRRSLEEEKFKGEQLLNDKNDLVGNLDRLLSQMREMEEDATDRAMHLVTQEAQYRQRKQSLQDAIEITLESASRAIRDLYDELRAVKLVVRMEFDNE